MAIFIKNAEITDKIDRIINESREELFIVSPYIQFSDRMIDYLENAAKQTRLTLIFGKDRTSAEKELSQINHINCTILYKKNLHAKCYLNEKSAIITSMNLYAYSQINNEEMGVYFEKDTDEEAYIQCSENLNSIMDSAVVIKEYSEPGNEKEENVIEITSLSHRNILYFLKAIEDNYICSDIKAYRFGDEKPSEYICIHNFPKKDINLGIYQSVISFDLLKIRQLMNEVHDRLLYRDIEFIIDKYKYRIEDFLYQNDDYYQFHWNGYIINVYWTINKKNCPKGLLHKKFQVLQQVSLIVQQAEIELSDYIMKKCY